VCACNGKRNDGPLETFAIDRHSVALILESKNLGMKKFALSLRSPAGADDIQTSPAFAMALSS
jgi:hypothetical protein